MINNNESHVPFITPNSGATPGALHYCTPAAGYNPDRNTASVDGRRYLALRAQQGYVQLQAVQARGGLWSETAAVLGTLKDRNSVLFLERSSSSSSRHHRYTVRHLPSGRFLACQRRTGALTWHDRPVQTNDEYRYEYEFVPAAAAAEAYHIRVSGTPLYLDGRDPRLWARPATAAAATAFLAEEPDGVGYV